MILNLIVSITALLFLAPSLLSTLQINMDPINLGYSTKNIPTAQPKIYLRYLLDKTQTFLQRMRWRAYHFLNPTETTAAKENFGFKTTNCTPPIIELRDFEERMLRIVQSIEFKNTNSAFQKKLSQDIKKIHKDNELYIPADKTTNYYRVKPDSYQSLLKANINKSYKKAPMNSAANIIAEEKKIAKKLGLDNRIDKLAEKEGLKIKRVNPNRTNGVFIYLTLTPDDFT